MVKTQQLRTAKVHAPYINDTLFLPKQYFTYRCLGSTDCNVTEIKEGMEINIFPNAQCIMKVKSC